MFLGLWRGVHPQRLPSCLQGRLLHERTEAACILEKWGTKSMYISMKVGEIKGRKIKLLKHIIVLYSLPIIFSKIFSLANTRSIAFYGKRTFPPPPRTKAPVLATFSNNAGHSPPICFRLLDVQFRCTFSKVLKTEHKICNLA